MKRMKSAGIKKVNNWLKHRETQDDIWDYMASKWASRAEAISRYGKQHLPSPIKTVLRTTVKNPIDAAKRYNNARQESAGTRKAYLRFSNEGQ